MNTAGRDSREICLVMLAVDLMFMPTKASLSDLELLKCMVDTIETAQDYNPDLNVAVFINMTPTNSQSEKITV